MQKKSIPNSEVARPPDLGARIAELEEREAEHLRSEQIQSALYHIADAASAVEDMRSFYAEMHRIVDELMHVDTFSIVLYDQPSQTVSFSYIVEEVGQEEAPPKSLREALGRTLTAYVIRTGEPLLAPPETVEELERTGEVDLIGSPSVDWLGVPLRSEGETLGALVVQTYAEQVRYTVADRDILVFISQHIASALTHARLLDENRQKAAELAIINTISEGLAKHLDLQGVIDVVGGELREVFSAQVLAIEMYDRHTNLLHAPYIIERGQRLEAEAIHLERGFSAHIIKTRQPLLLNEKVEDVGRELGSFVQVGEPSKSYLGAPILTGDEVTGVISLQELDREHAFSEADVRLLSTITANMGIALDNVRLFEEERQRAAELAVINSVGVGLAEQLDFQGIVDLVGNKIQEVFDAQVVTIAQYDHRIDISREIYVWERGERLEPLPPGPLVNGVQRHTIQTRRPVVVNDNLLQRAAEYGAGIIVGDVPQSMVWVPILKGDEVSGTVSLQNLDREHAFSESDVRLLSTIAASMGMALENARLFQEERQRAAELAVINSVGQALAKQLDFQGVIDLVGDKVREVFEAQGAYIALYDRDANLISFPYFRTESERFEIPTAPPGPGFTNHIIRTGKLSLIHI